MSKELREFPCAPRFFMASWPALLKYAVGKSQDGLLCSLWVFRGTVMRAVVALGLFVLLGCSGGGSVGQADSVVVDDAPGGQEAPEFWSETVNDGDSLDLPLADEVPGFDEGLSDQGAPEDPGAPADQGPPSKPDLSPDQGPGDAGQILDTGPGYSETVAACIYVVEGLCDKFIKRCDDMAFNIIPDEWLEACASFLKDRHDLVTMACLQLDSVESSDPNVALIKTFGPVALRECVDNFQCKWETIGAIADFIMPIIQGQKIDTSSILNLIVKLCFSS